MKSFVRILMIAPLLIAAMVVEAGARTKPLDIFSVTHPLDNMGISILDNGEVDVANGSLGWKFNSYEGRYWIDNDDGSKKIQVNITRKDKNLEQIVIQGENEASVIQYKGKEVHSQTVCDKSISCWTMTKPLCQDLAKKSGGWTAFRSQVAAMEKSAASQNKLSAALQATKIQATDTDANIQTMDAVLTDEWKQAKQARAGNKPMRIDVNTARFAGNPQTYVARACAKYATKYGWSKGEAVKTAKQPAAPVNQPTAQPGEPGA